MTFRKGGSISVHDLCLEWMLSTLKIELGLLPILIIIKQYLLRDFNHGPEYALISSDIMCLIIGPEDLRLHSRPHNPKGVRQYIANQAC